MHEHAPAERQGLKIALLILVAAAAFALIAHRALGQASPPIHVADQAYALRMAGRLDDARHLLLEAIKADPANAMAQFELARVQFYAQDLAAAQMAIDTATKAQPNNARYHYWAGLIATYRGIRAHAQSGTAKVSAVDCFKTAIAAFEQAVALKSDFHKARLRLIETYVGLPAGFGRDRTKAQQHVDEMERQDVVPGVVGQSIVMSDDAAENVLPAWRKIITEHANDANAHEGFARALMRVGRIDEAIRHFDKAIELDSNRSVNLLDVARYHVLKERDHKRAEQMVQRYLDSDRSPPRPMRAYATFMLARIALMQGDEARANELMAESKQLDPHGWTTLRQPPQDLFVTPGAAVSNGWF